MPDSSLTFGKVVPTVWANGAEFYRVLPEWAEMYTVTLRVRRTDEADLASARADRKAASELLAAWGVDCILAGGVPVSTVEDVDPERAFVEAMRAELPVPFTTSLQAQIDALRAVGAESLLLVSPFVKERDDEAIAHLTHHGFEVVAAGGVSEPDVGRITRMPPSTSYRCANALAEETAEAFDAVSVLCSTWRGVDYIAALESDIGTPVVTATQAQIWSACRMAGVRPTIEGYGQLFETL